MSEDSVLDHASEPDPGNAIPPVPAPVVEDKLVEGSITGFFGAPRSGKSLGAIKHILWLIKKGRCVGIVTNAPLVVSKWSVPIVFKTHDEIAVFSVDEKHKNWVILVDECSAVWSAQRWQWVLKNAPKAKDWISVAGHLGCHVILICQGWQEFITFIRDKVQTAYFCRRLGPIGSVRGHMVEDRKPGAAIGKIWLWFKWSPPHYANFYDTVGKVGGGEPGREGMKIYKTWRWLPWTVILVLIFFLGIAVWFGKGFLGGKVKDAVGSFTPTIVTGVAKKGAADDLPKNKKKVEAEVYSRKLGAFIDSLGDRIDPIRGVSDAGASDWSVEWDRVRSQANNAGRNFIGATEDDAVEGGSGNGATMRPVGGGNVGRGNRNPGTTHPAGITGRLLDSSLPGGREGKMVGGPDNGLGGTGGAGDH